MKLVTPTDFDILDCLSDGERNNATNIACQLDKNRPYINTRLPTLADYELVESIGPSENSGLYAITDRGLRVLEHQDAYGDDDVDFDKLISTEQTE
jgi:hypothetical protein